MSSPKVAAPLFMHILHVLRAVNGGFIIFKLPKTSNIIDDVNQQIRPTKDQSVPSEEFGQFVTEATKTMVTAYTEKLVNIPIIVYFILTCVMFILDLVVFFVGVSLLSNDFEEYSYGSVMMLTISSVFMSFDLYYIIWATSFFFKMPDSLNRKVIEALIGFGQKIKNDLGIVHVVEEKPPKNKDVSEPKPKEPKERRAAAGAPTMPPQKNPKLVKK